MLVLAALLTTTLAPPPAPNPQQGTGGFEALRAELERRTAARRQAAAQAWVEHGPAYMKQPAKPTMAPLLAVAPEIQDPLFAALRERLAVKPVPTNDIQGLLFVLQEVVDQGGASRLMALLPELPASSRPDVLRNAVSRGDARTVDAARAWLAAPDPALREAALESLLLHDPVERLPELAQRIDLDAVNPELFTLTLEELARRPLTEDFRLPADCFEAEDPLLRRSLAGFLAAHPQEDAEAFLIALALDAGQSLGARQAALDAYVSGAEKYRWRAGVRDFERYLKDQDRSQASEAVAWALHRLGERRGRRYLLEPVEAKAKRNPDDWQVQLELGRMQVDVGEFADGYRTFKNTFDDIDNTPIARRLRPEDYLYASRAAAGSGHRREAGDWLEATRMSREELAPYRDLPEFADHLKREPFSRLFPPPAE